MPVKTPPISHSTPSRWCILPPSDTSDFSWSQLLGALVMINARLFRALVNASPNNAQIIGADNGRLRADIDRIISQLFS